MSKTRAEQGIILEWCKCKCHGSPSPHISADGKSQLGNFWGQVGHSQGVANLHNEASHKSGLVCVPEKNKGISMLAILALVDAELMIAEYERHCLLIQRKISQMKHSAELRVRKCQRKSIVSDQYRRGIPLIELDPQQHHLIVFLSYLSEVKLL